MTELKNRISARLRAFRREAAVVIGNGSRMIQFGIFEVDLRAGELRRNGARVRLQEQPFQVLATLLERPGEVVTREELQSRLWPADTFVDFDHSLNAAVRRLRDALGDTAENPRFVETVARRGYRFLAPVNGASHPAVTEIKAPAAKPGRKWWIAGAAVLLLAGLVVGLFVGRRGSPSSSPTSPVTGRRLTANPDEDPVSSAALSPDGKYLAFSDDTGSYLRQIDTGETHPLALPEGFKAKPVAWFPDGTHILATSVAGPAQEPGLWQLSALGGSPRKLALATSVAGPAQEPGLWQLSALGGSPRKLVDDAQEAGRLPRRLSDCIFQRSYQQPGTLADGRGRRAAPKTRG